MKRGLLVMATALVVGGAAGAGVVAHLERAAEPPAVMVRWTFDRTRENKLACRVLCESRGLRPARYQVTAPKLEDEPEGCVAALRGACGVAP